MLISIILGIFILNFIFVFTDWIAGKGLNICAIIYSPISNEGWLSFIGVFVGGFSTFLLFCCIFWLLTVFVFCCG